MEAKLREIIATYLEQLPMAKVVAEKSQKPVFPPFPTSVQEDVFDVNDY